MEILQNIFGILLLAFFIIGILGIWLSASDIGIPKEKEEKEESCHNIYFNFTNHS